MFDNLDFASADNYMWSETFHIFHHTLPESTTFAPG